MPARRSPPPFRFQVASGRYIDPRGRFLARADVRAEIDRVIGKSAARTKALAADLREGRLTVDNWRSAMRAEVKTQHVQQAMVAAGGRENMTPSLNGRVGAMIKKQYAFLDGFAAEVEKGLPLDGRFAARSALYPNASRGTFHQIERTGMLSLGYDQERNILGNAEHCTQCVEETARGWVGLGELSPITGRLCGPNDKCRLQYRNSETGAVSAR